MEERKDIFDKIMSLPGLRIFEEFYKKNKEVLLYLFFGGLTFIVSIGSYTLFCVPLKMNVLIANVLSWILAVAFAYVTNRIWVFNSKASGINAIIKEMISFVGGRVFTLAVEELLLFVFITLLGMNAIVIKVIGQVVVTVLNYVVSKLFVFKEKKIAGELQS